LLVNEAAGESLPTRLFPPIAGKTGSSGGRSWKDQLRVPDTPQKTPFYDLNVANGGKMVEFGGYLMPVQYSSLGIVDSHNFTRTQASLFDVSHMTQHVFSGPLAASFLEKVTPADVATMGILQSKLSAFLWPETGGIVDDTIITRTGEQEFYVVTNAATREKIFKYLLEETKDIQKEEGPVEARQFWWSFEPDRALLALQGPASVEILRELLPSSVDIQKLYFGNVMTTPLKYIDGSGNWTTTESSVLITRGGYTGEDGFEISTPPDVDSVAIAKTLLTVGGPEKIQFAGLGPRDSLRLEAGMCLYGHDLDDTTTPIEAGLAWIIPPERRANGGFHGDKVILGQLLPKSKGGQGVSRRRVGFVISGAPAREGAEIRTKEGEKIGVITSGSPSPTLGKNIAMGYIRDGFQKAGTEVDVVVRGRARSAVVHKMPFVPPKYHKEPPAQ
jgi:aminomethyltransferase